jgi:hypothetical protein
MGSVGALLGTRRYSFDQILIPGKKPLFLSSCAAERSWGHALRSCP